MTYNQMRCQHWPLLGCGRWMTYSFCIYFRVLCYAKSRNAMIYSVFSYYLRLLMRRDGGALAVPDDEHQDQIVNVIHH
ncbi:hypothetical protein BQ9544_4592 [Escherichia coli O127:H6]|nr:hypothetical protein BQ9544_4592 [Escherichia coli O127:H6]SNU18781.1 hypothetical protein BQ9550_4592 [Escherichia coli O127:H6]STN52557.1 Uncharacterised protein [Escherichia coli]